MLDHPEITRLAELTALEVDTELTAAYPAQQGSEVILTLRDGPPLARRLPNVIPATPDEIRTRFIRAAESVLGRDAVQELAATIDELESQPRVDRLANLTGLSKWKNTNS